MQLAVTMTGLVPVMVKALADVPQVCRAVLSSGESWRAFLIIRLHFLKLFNPVTYNGLFLAPVCHLDYVSSCPA